MNIHNLLSKKFPKDNIYQKSVTKVDEKKVCMPLAELEPPNRRDPNAINYEFNNNFQMLAQHPICNI